MNGNGHPGHFVGIFVCAFGEHMGAFLLGSGVGVDRHTLGLNLTVV